MKDYLSSCCEICGREETFDGGDWIDTTGVWHVVCAQCHDALVEQYDESIRPEPELFGYSE